VNILMLGVGDAGLQTPDSEPVRRLLEYARRADGRIDLVVDSPRGGRNDYGGMTVRRTGTNRLRYPFAAYRLAAEAAREHAPDLITSQDPFGTALVGLWLRGAWRRPLLIQNHSCFLSNPYWLAERPILFRAYHLLARYLLPRADAWRVVNRREKEWYVQRLCLPGEKIRVLPVPCDLAAFEDVSPAKKAEYRRRWALAPDAKVVVWAGRPVRFKRLPLLFAAFAEIRERIPGARLIIAGRQDLAQEDLDRAARRKRLGDSLLWAGELAHGELAALFGAADVFLFPSVYEGFGRTLVEAGAAGLPAVATATAGAGDIVRDGETGFLVPLEDARALAERAAGLLADPGNSRRMGAAAREHIRRTFDPTKMSAAIVDQWRAVAGMDVFA
jgi:glycosyltransferase involved in cell wall biosynthesis